MPLWCLNTILPSPRNAPTLTGTFESEDVDVSAVTREARATFEIDDLVTVGDTVEIGTDHRTVEIEIVVDATVEMESVDACRGPSGHREVV